MRTRSLCCVFGIVFIVFMPYTTGEPETYCFKMNRKNQKAPAASEIESLVVESVNECGIKCGRKLPDCISVSYNDVTKVCILQKTFSHDPVALPVDAPGFEFLDMKDIVNVCDLESPCKNNATCSAGSGNEYTCNCTSEVYDGKNCTELVGQVLLIGNDMVNDMEIYNTEIPANSKILDIILSQTRMVHVAELFDNGIVAIAGGRKGGATTSDTDLYDIKTNEIVSGPSMSQARMMSASAMLNNEMFVCGGGPSPALGICEKLMFNPATNQFQWQTKASMTRQRSAPAMVELNGRLYVMGGDNGPTLNDVERYDPGTNLWTFVGGMLTQRTKLAAAVLNGFIYACGGDNLISAINTCEKYDVSLNTWTPIASLNTKRHSHSMVTTGGKIYAFGGIDGGGMAVDEVEMYDPTTGSWTVVNSMKSTRAYHTAILLK